LRHSNELVNIRTELVGRSTELVHIAIEQVAPPIELWVERTEQGAKTPEPVDRRTGSVRSATGSFPLR
jgi:hypothetical protein